MIEQKRAFTGYIGEEDALERFLKWNGCLYYLEIRLLENDLNRD